MATGLDTAERLSSSRPVRLRASGFFWRNPWAKAVLLLAPPLLAFTLVYLASLAALFISSFWSVNPFTTEIEHIWNVDNFKTLWEASAYRTIALRTIGIAAAVTLADALLAFPLAYFMARVASVRTRTILFVGVLLPLWSSYLVRVYIWRLILNHDGVLNWTLGKVFGGHLAIAYSNWAVWLIFTFSLTLGDYVTPLLAGGSSSQFIGNVVYESVGVSNNVPFAAAFAAVPLCVMGVYLLLARRLGAFEAM